MTALAQLTAAFDAETVDGRIPLLQPGTKISLRPVPVAETFCNDTLAHADWLLDQLVWNLGVDREAEVLELTTSLQADYQLIDRDIRDDAFIRARATATLRRLSAIFIKADAFGLVEYGNCIDPASLACPDFYDHLSR
jgi:hypothetical protein